MSPGTVNGDKTFKSNMTKPTHYDEVVISGISGRYPESNNLYELRDNLMNKVDMVTQNGRRWTSDNPDIPKRSGKVNNLGKFDSLFFGMSPKQANAIDPMSRILIEHAWEAIVDAGVNPKTIRGSRTGVYIGLSLSETEKALFYDQIQSNGYGVLGCAHAMFANRVSYNLDLTGPSYILDSACSSSVSAIEHAYKAIREGECDAAIVGGSHLALHPYVTMQFYKIGGLSKDGTSKCFDAAADGFVRSEAIVCAFLQKAKDAKRIYATVVHTKSNCDGYKQKGLTYPSRQMQTQLLKQVYNECGVSPSDISFIEAHGTGTKAGDEEEIHGIDAVLATTRTIENPLLIGSCKSNLGHSEPASGMVSISKIILAMETGLIAPNLHYKTLRPSLTPIVEGRMKVVTEITPFTGTYAAINSFGIGGVNAHLVLRSNPKMKINGGAPNDELPRLLAVSGRTPEAVELMLSEIEKKPVDVEFIKLLHDIYSEDIKNHIYRGYTILPSHGVVETPIKKIKLIPAAKRPIWFIYHGMGSQWPGMGADLMRIPLFAESVKKMDGILKPFGVDIYDILTNKNESVFEPIYTSIIGITAMQIALTDVLTALGVKPDYIAGHSLGEVVCAYADGCINLEEAIMASYLRGIAIQECKHEVLRGAMAAVGMAPEELEKMLPENVIIACYNSKQSVTISGPEESVKKFVADLNANKIFAKEVAANNIAYHSKYVAAVGPVYCKYLSKVITEPKLRSEKWISSSVPQQKWHTPNARYAKAEYFTNNLLEPVRFDKPLEKVQDDAILIELGPTGLLQSILSRACNPDVVKSTLTKKGEADSVIFLLKSLGELYAEGVQLNLANLYPHVEYPVSRSTPSISPLLRWQHSEDWFVPNYDLSQQLSSGERIVKVNMIEEEFKAYSGYVVDGVKLFPETGYLTLVWETLGMMHGKQYTDLSVVFENIQFLRPTTIPEDGLLKFTVMIQKGSGNFEIVESSEAIISGVIRTSPNVIAEKVNPIIPQKNYEEILTTKDAYKELRLRGYQFTGLYKSILRSTCDGTKGHIGWLGDWSALLNNVIQFHFLGVDSRNLLVPKSIKKLVIDIADHRVKESVKDKELEVYSHKLYNVMTCGGIEIQGFEYVSSVRKQVEKAPVLEEYKFVPYYDGATVTLREISRLATHLVLEHDSTLKLKVIEFIDESRNVSIDDLTAPFISEASDDERLVQTEIVIFSSKNDFPEGSLSENISVLNPKKVSGKPNVSLAIGHQLLTKEIDGNFNILLNEVLPGGFIVSRENTGNINGFDKIAETKGCHVVMKKRTDDEVFIILRKRKELRKRALVINVDNDKFDWVNEMKNILRNEVEKETFKDTRVIFVSQGVFENGLMGLFNCLKLEIGIDAVRAVMIQDPKAPAFSLNNPFYAKQLEKDLLANVLQENEVWGSYRHVPVREINSKLVEYAYVKQLREGELNSVTWLEGPNRCDLRESDIANISFASLNTRDILLANGQLPIESIFKKRLNQKRVLGFEYSGVDKTGKRIMGLVDQRTMANICKINRNLTWEVPKNWTLEDAATVPYAYASCYYGLNLMAHMKKGQKIFIHAGASDIGQTAINLALHENCEVFTNVSSVEEYKFIRRNFPQIQDDHIYQTACFEQKILEKTNGNGVNIALYSFTGEKLVSTNCVARGGHLIEINKIHFTVNKIEYSTRGVNFHSIMIDDILNNTEESSLELKLLVENGLKKGAIKPLYRKVFSRDEVEMALRYMAAGEHIGKVVVRIHKENESVTDKIPAKPHYYCLRNKSYIIMGGNGGFGIELIDWLILKGARNIVIASRSGLTNGYQKSRVELWKSYGVNIVMENKDPSKFEECKSIIETANCLAPVDGIYNLAVVLNDASWQNQTPESFEYTFKCKAYATKNLDVLSRKMCPQLRHFVMFSSNTCGRGNPGQSNYGMASSVMEKICEKRHKEGFPTLVIQWGPIGDVGVIAEELENNRDVMERELRRIGFVPQGIKSCLNTVDYFLHQNKPITSSIIIPEKNVEETKTLNITERILTIIGLKNFKDLNPNTLLTDLGAESILAVEIKQTFEREFDIFLTSKEIQNLTLKRLQEMSDDKLKEN